ncbi:hypothetical protein CIHG_07537 [Coccidioides immitis H538.4]|uniref:Uncharacterized protein n=2 Tax=Coccidioides immitis TaxID=5501 RepID=A0A0J8S0B5_COCIT|nr:hypothetical protein CIRG_07828 [Coccidioides immitis RMSCC 2394]KMU89854.1 hypothetical protein CIHG_07537 [Coccidioides immitis H538.4]
MQNVGRLECGFSVSLTVSIPTHRLNPTLQFQLATSCGIAHFRPDVASSVWKKTARRKRLVSRALLPARFFGPRVYACRGHLVCSVSLQCAPKLFGDRRSTTASVSYMLAGLVMPAVLETKDPLLKHPFLNYTAGKEGSPFGVPS